MRGFIIVLDSFGVGEAPDAKSFGDEGASTIKTISKSKYFKCLICKKWDFLQLTESDLIILQVTMLHTAG